MTPSSRLISSPIPWEGAAASAAAGSSSSHPGHFIEGAHPLKREDPEYCRQYLQDMHDIFSEKILEAIAGGDGKEKDHIYQPLHYAYFDREVFLEIEGRRESPTSAGGFGRGSVSESQIAFNQLLLDVVKETIRDANTSTSTDFDPEKPLELQGLTLDQRRIRLPITHANFISRIEGVALKVFSSKVPDQKKVTAAMYFAKSKRNWQGARDRIALQAQEASDKFIDNLAGAHFSDWLAQPDLHQRFYEELLALDPASDGALVIDFHTLTGYCSQLEALPIGSEGVLELATAVCAIKDRIIASLRSLGLDPHMQMQATRECDVLVANVVQKHRVPQMGAGVVAIETPSSLDSAKETQSVSVAESQEVPPLSVAACLEEGVALSNPPLMPAEKAE